MVPFPLFELQAEACLAQLKSECSLPDRSERLQHAEEAVGGEGMEDGRVEDTHYLGGKQWDYGRRMAKYGGVYDMKTAEYKPQNMVDRNKFTFGTPDPQEGQPRIFSILSFNHEFNMMAFSMIANSTWADRHVDFSHYMKIAVDNTEVQEFGDADIAEFIHPVTNQRYMAPNTSDGKSLSYDMVQWANRLKNRWLDSVEDMDNKKAIYDQLREAYDANFNPLSCEDATLQQNDPDLGAVCQAMLEFDLSRDAQNNRSEQLNDVVAKLDQVRFLWKALGSSVLR